MEELEEQFGAFGIGMERVSPEVVPWFPRKEADLDTMGNNLL
jgi:hypothetical protein